MRARQTRREEPLGHHMPDPVIGGDPEHEALLVDAVGLALLVNGAAGQVRFRDGRPFSVLGFTIAGDRVKAIDILADPKRLATLDISVLEG